jgi:hypothetical protein
MSVWAVAGWCSILKSRTKMRRALNLDNLQYPALTIRCSTQDFQVLKLKQVQINQVRSLAAKIAASPCHDD